MPALQPQRRVTELPSAQVKDPQINNAGALAYSPDEFADSLCALAEGDIDAAPLITGEVGLDGVGAAFDDLADPERHCKILVTP